MIFGLLLLLCYRFPKVGFGNLDEEDKNALSNTITLFSFFEFIFEAFVLVSLLA